jgi:hypothetical protein
MTTTRKSGSACRCVKERRLRKVFRSRKQLSVLGHELVQAQLAHDFADPKTEIAALKSGSKRPGEVQYLHTSYLEEDEPKGHNRFIAQVGEPMAGSEPVVGSETMIRRGLVPQMSKCMFGSFLWIILVGISLFHLLSYHEYEKTRSDPTNQYGVRVQRNRQSAEAGFWLSSYLSFSRRPT